MSNENVYNTYELMKEDWVIKACINRMVDSPYFIDKVKELLNDGETGGDIDWGIQKWSEEIGEVYHVEYFAGYRAFMGPDEHGLNDTDEDVEFFCEFNELQKYIKEALLWYQNKCPEHKTEAELLISGLS